MSGPSDELPADERPEGAQAVDRLLRRLAMRRVGAGALFLDPDAEEFQGALALDWLARGDFALKRMVMFDAAFLPRNLDGDIFCFRHEVGEDERIDAFAFYPAPAYAQNDLFEHLPRIELQRIDMDTLEHGFLAQMEEEGVHVRLCPKPDESAALFPARAVREMLALLRGGV